ncbi:DegT/DnrJ/EryC1/StrS aminotransferase family protein [Candidatus Saccharibacteria bacterium]|nr:DegT/DnrJ/EryC1/StrS aminotransferase family protein [Candidatus Saccharibacteria bacterium]
MPRRYYLGLNAGGPSIRKMLFTHGNAGDLRELNEFLAEKYQGAPILCKNGRSALALALKAYFDPGDKIIVNGFTCYAVYEAVVAAGMTPVFIDIDPKNLNFSPEILDEFWKKLEKTHHSTKQIRGIIVQNTLGNPVEIKKIQSFANEHGLTIIEDLAHSAGIKYNLKTEAGMVGAATVLSFGKDKSINTISGGVAVLRAPQKHEIKAPTKRPRFSDVARDRFYPLFTAECRALNHIHLGGVLMRFLITIHFVEKSADNRLSLNRRIPKFEAKLALKQLKKFHKRGEATLRDFYLVRDRAEVLKKLRSAGYYFDSFWYEKPVSPVRYYKEVKFPEKDCPNAVKVSNEIINFPKYYTEKDLKKAKEIIKPYLVGEFYG